MCVCVCDSTVAVRPCGETMCQQANANTPLSANPLLNVPESWTSAPSGDCLIRDVCTEMLAFFHQDSRPDRSF